MKGAAKYDLLLDSARNRKKENVRKWKFLATIFALAFEKRHKLSGSLTSHVWYDDSYFSCLILHICAIVQLIDVGCLRDFPF